ATDVSATTSITIGFSAEMDEADVESRFAIAPDVAGDLTWDAGQLVFTPTERLVPGARYTISVNGAHDRRGNALGGELNFSFIVQAGAQLITTDPKLGASDVEPATVEMWFSQPMDVDATNAAFALVDTTTGAPVGGHLVWNEAGTQVIYTPDQPLAGGRTFDVTIGDGGLDAAGNPVTASWSFTTKAAPVATTERSSTAASTRSATAAPAPVIPPPAPASDAAGYAVNQINAARAAYGFGPVVLDPTISAVAYGHAYDQAINNYFSHTGLDGSTRDSRLRAGGVSFGWSGENQCYLIGRSVTATLDWCHSAFMSEPYPGYWNHIANVLNPNAHRVGVGIAQVGGKIVIVWDFTD
ncbi:MAG TPA: Ig-like domain-containing protein, partial [Candidatus Limnocylindria bacterium]|nr:Ig-like domain-containing protein [Candidatus Limnocylindria bacterium]